MGRNYGSGLTGQLRQNEGSLDFTATERFKALSKSPVTGSCAEPRPHSSMPGPRRAGAGRYALGQDALRSSEAGHY